MSQILKFQVHADKLAPLHALLKGPLFNRVSYNHWHSEKGVETKKHCLGKIIRSQSKDGETYSVTIKMEFSYHAKPDEAGREAFQLVFPGIELMQAIYDILGVYPKEERVEPSR
jgi:hypothetical protein